MKQPHHHYSTLFPLIAAGSIVILTLLVIASYQKTASMIPTVILPGGVTYLGK